MSESSRPPEPKNRPPPRERGADEKIGRVLGRAFGRIKQTRAWKDTARAYKDGVEGKGDR